MKPIGYWLNRTDLALTRSMDALLADAGLTRLGWQVLNAVEGGPTAPADVHALLAANADTQTLTGVIDSLTADDWLSEEPPGPVSLTPAGRTRFAAAATRVAAFRERSTEGITPEEYRTAVCVLERIALNAEAGTGMMPVPASSAIQPLRP
ncbi:MarR family winged helix-turn-helix transcriptional regulator [Streptomyces sp. NBC_00503]|uniref:MarR family winged helix-turn-helix transcriptional regulator n=1 Tax=Streptomyces sp. NBC_00503 TaxID=2903659 RepID=UPI002E8227C7|nr:MarR family winged helix-turn-helix transcriptional regulator [Streptomyces sp. NBC_00503]WUD83991.1 MarR family winged helix-turn-helix transcriptional regulator [Streptomyces sp. NBC_00503]